MRTFIKNYIDAKKRQKLEETGEEGFSLVELIVVIVVIGILIAVAFPIFGAVQQNAKVGALNSAAAEGATVAASEYALGVNTTKAQLDPVVATSNTADYTLVVRANPTGLNDICVDATGQGALAGAVGEAGPGC
jgi:type IV pilus assembly protein PilA